MDVPRDSRRPESRWQPFKDDELDVVPTVMETDCPVVELQSEVISVLERDLEDIRERRSAGERLTVTKEGNEVTQPSTLIVEFSPLMVIVEVEKLPITWIGELTTMWEVTLELDTQLPLEAHVKLFLGIGAPGQIGTIRLNFKPIEVISKV